MIFPVTSMKEKLKETRFFSNLLENTQYKDASKSNNIELLTTPEEKTKMCYQFDKLTPSIATYEKHLWHSTNDLLSVKNSKNKKVKFANIEISTSVHSTESLLQKPNQISASESKKELPKSNKYQKFENKSNYKLTSKPWKKMHLKDLATDTKLDSKKDLFSIDHYFDPYVEKVPDLYLVKPFHKNSPSLRSHKDISEECNSKVESSKLVAIQHNNSLHEAARAGDIATIERLLYNNANPWEPDESGNLPLDVAKNYTTAKILSEATVFYSKQNKCDNNLLVSKKIIFEL